MRILITCDRLDTLGGLEEHVTDKINFLLSHNNIVHLDCNAIGEHYLNKIKHKNLTISSPWSANWNDISDIGDFKPDIIHAHPFSAISRGWLVQQKFFPVPLILTIHGEYAYTVSPEILKTVYKVILTNNKIKKYKNTIVIPNGIDIKRFSPRSYDSFNLKEKVIVVATRLQDNKEIPVLQFIQACNHLTSDNITVYIVGDGMYVDEVKSKIRELKIAPGKIQFNVMGGVSKIEEYYNMATLVLGCDRVALEALCCCKNVFYMGQGHLKDIITSYNYEDYLFSNKGIKQYSEFDLAKKIDELLMRFSFNGFNQINLYETIRDKYSVESQMRQILNLYNEVLNVCS